MQRSRVTVQYGHMPSQVFEHEVDGVYCVVRDISGGRPDIPIEQVLEALELQLTKWRAAGGDASGFPSNVMEHADTFRLVRPELVRWDVWPTRLFCGSCGHVLLLRTSRQAEAEIPASRRCRQCRTGTYRQLPYYQVHACGKRQQLQLPQCPDHPNDQRTFEDTGSFVTAGFRCSQQTCRRWLGMRFATCNGCTFAAADPANRTRNLTPVTARDTRAYYGHRLTLVNVDAQMRQARNNDRAAVYALGHYMGTIGDLSGMLAAGRGAGAPSPSSQAVDLLNMIRERYPDDVETIARAQKVVDETRGDEPALERTRTNLQPSTVVTAAADRRTLERAFLHARHSVDNLADVAAALSSAGSNVLADRIRTGLETARQLGLARISLVREFPIALVGYGFSRVHSDVRARLLPLDATRDTEQLPLIAVDADTEGLLVEADPVVLWHFCRANGWTPRWSTSEEPTPEQARAWVLDTSFSAVSTDAADAIRRVTHVWSHLLMHALAYHSSFSANSVGEYLLERAASTLIFVAKFNSFNLGALGALAEQHLQLWLTDAADAAASCVHDPVCLAERGGCHKCLAVAFGCERFNRGLDRGYLVGGGRLAIQEGFLYTAARLANR
ncbi:hypothetical protein GCM10009555_061220 [Acrocarpospora macrocephala]|uniref:Uncharacterized protein n=2 Tax=Acrocarpospora macrocephala TaxID=150177 RepID=A0A5M3WK25_9ACTN|nr:hypothetical protein Amac_031610 [Acrocarpospora macrocephala]